jgi:hypothetical protein
MFAGLPSLDDLVGTLTGTSNGSAATNLPGNVQEYGNEIRAKKADLKARGASAKQIKNNPQVASMVQQLEQMKAQAGIDPKTNLAFGTPLPAKKPALVNNAPAQKALPRDLQGVGLQIRDLKENLKQQGLNNQQVRNHPNVAQLTGQLNNAMRQRQPGCQPSAKQNQRNLPQDLQCMRNELQGVKQQLRSQGLKGQQLVNHPQVASMQKSLDQQVRERGLNRSGQMQQVGRQAPMPPPPRPTTSSFVGTTSFAGGQNRAAAMQAATAASAGSRPNYSGGAPGVPYSSSFAQRPGVSPSGIPPSMSFSQHPGMAPSGLPPSMSFSQRPAMPPSRGFAQHPAGVPPSMSFSQGYIQR